MKLNFRSNPLSAALMLLSLFFSSSSVLAAEADHDDEHQIPAAEHAEDGHAEDEHSEAEEDHADSVVIEPGMAQQAGITTAVAGPGVIREAITVYGRTIMDPQGISQIRARFPGLIVSIEPGVGDTVAAGDTVAEIESNESLNRYRIQSPIDGVVTSRNANPGETTGDQPLLTIANYELLWAELAIFPLNAQRIEAGQEVILKMGDQAIQSSISHIAPGPNESPAVVARVPLDNADGRWSPGLLMQADITIDQAEVALAVDSRAIQTFENNPVVFVQEGDIYESRPVELGRKDDEFTEILSGLEPGDRYVVENSYLIKADLEKSSAEHAH